MTPADRLVVALRNALLADVTALREPTLGMRGGVNRGEVVDAINRCFAGVTLDPRPARDTTLRDAAQAGLAELEDAREFLASRALAPEVQERISAAIVALRDAGVGFVDDPEGLDRDKRHLLDKLHAAYARIEYLEILAKTAPAPAEGLREAAQAVVDWFADVEGSRLDCLDALRAALKP